MFTISFCLLGWSLYKHDLPSFDDPLVGFEVRGLDIANRINTWRLLIESTSWNGLLSLYPKPYRNAISSIQNETNVHLNSKQNRSQTKHEKKLKKKLKKLEIKNPIEDDLFHSKNHIIQSENFFCGKIYDEYVQFVVETIDGRNLFELTTIKNICKLDEIILRMSHIDEQLFNSSQFHFQNYCEIKNSNDCCPSWTLSNFILFYANKTDCDLLIENDLDDFTSLLTLCSPFYAGQYLNEECFDDPSQCPNVPESCYLHSNLVYNVFHYLVDYKFFDMNKQILSKNDTEFIENADSNVRSKRPLLSSTNIFLPMAKSSKLLTYYDTISTITPSQLLNGSDEQGGIGILSYENVHIVAADLGLKHALFSRSLVSDLILALFAASLIHASLFIFTKSIILTFTVFLTNISSLTCAYFIYICVFELDFFPFINLLALIILIGKFH